MADNIELNAGSGGATIATDDDGTAQHQYVKVEFGGDGTFTKVTSAVGLPVSDAGGSLTVDGTVAVTGVATAANQTTIIGHVDGIEGLLTTIDADTGTVAGAVAGTEMQVDVVAALPAGNNNIGDVDIASIAAGDNNIGNVDVVTLPGSAHDAAVSGTPVRIGAYAKTTAPTDVSADGDTVNLWADLAGRLQVGDGGATLSVDDGGGNLSIDDGGNTITVDGTVAVTNGGTFAVQVDGNALTSLQLIDDGIATTGAAITAKGMTACGTDGTNARALKTDASGELQVDVLTVPTITVNSHAVTNAGTFAVQVDGSALTALQKIDDPVLVDDAAFTPATSSVSMAGFQADEASTDSVDEGDAGAARMTLDRKLIVTPQPHTAGGLSIFRSLDLDETEEDIKTSAGCVYGAWVTNTATTTRWLKFYNLTAANTTVGSSTPVITIGIPGNTSDDISANFGPGGMGIMFDTAICAAATTGVADADTGAPAANDVIINVFYK